MSLHTISAVVEPVPGYELRLMLDVTREPVRDYAGPDVDLELRGAKWPEDAGGGSVTDAHLLAVAEQYVADRWVEILDEIGW